VSESIREEKRGEREEEEEGGREAGGEKSEGVGGGREGEFTNIADGQIEEGAWSRRF
jgi:hypothetical protein